MVDPQPTPIDSQIGHFIVHPDYPSSDTFHTGPDGKPVWDKNGRDAHVNQLHFQLDRARFTSARTT